MITLSTWKLASLVLTLLLLLNDRFQLAQSQQSPVDLTERIAVGSIEFKGSQLQVFEIDSAQFAEPSIQFDKFCGIIKYNHLYLKYQLSLPIILGANALQKPLDGNKRLAQLAVSKIQVIADKALASDDSQLRIMVQLRTQTEARLLILCSDFDRCEQLKIELTSNPQRLQRAIEFSALGVIGGAVRVKFGDLVSSNPPPASGCLSGKWVVFQRRVDASLSFAQNWDTYVKGFGNSHSNYWMGLNQLYTSTVSSEKHSFIDASRCQLRVELTDQADNKYWGQYKIFQVLSPDQNYRLRVLEQEVGSTVEQMLYHNEMPFSTFDRDNDRSSGSCSRLYGYGGWWFAAGVTVNANAAYPPEGAARSPTYFTMVKHNVWVPMKTSVMMFKCDY